MAKKRVGLMKCEGQRCESHEHNVPVVMFENEKGTLSYACGFCGRAPYARPGTGQHAEWLAEMQRTEAKQETPPAPTPKPVAAPPAPVPKAPGQTGEKPAKSGAGTFFG